MGPTSPAHSHVSIRGSVGPWRKFAPTCSGVPLTYLFATWFNLDRIVFIDLVCDHSRGLSSLVSVMLFLLPTLSYKKVISILFLLLLFFLYFALITKCTIIYSFLLFCANNKIYYYYLTKCTIHYCESFCFFL